MPEDCESIANPDQRAELEALVAGIDREKHLGRVPYWQRALQAVDPMGIDNPNPGDAEYWPEAEYFSLLEAANHLSLESAQLVFSVMFGAAQASRPDVRDSLQTLFRI